MKAKEMKVVAPEGYEIDKDNSTFECIKFKPIKKKLTYEDVVKELFKGRNKYIRSFLTIDGWKESVCTSDKQVEKLLAINKLMNVAKYLNGKAKTMPKDGRLYYLRLENGDIKSDWIIPSVVNYGCVFFYSRELAQLAIDILGEDTIRTALSIDW